MDFVALPVGAWSNALVFYSTAARGGNSTRDEAPSPEIMAAVLIMTSYENGGRWLVNFLFYVDANGLMTQQKNPPIHNLGST